MTTENLNIDIQVENVEDTLPAENEFENWIASTLEQARLHSPQAIEKSHRLLNSLNSANARAQERTKEQTIELTVRIVNEEEGSSLNQTYRGKIGPTNVLSFPFELPEGMPDDLQLPLLGDIVLCAPLVKKQALEQNKAEKNHWAHLTVHGTLHLLGYDHINAEDAAIMENLEINILSKLGIPDPYCDNPSHSQAASHLKTNQH